MVAEENKVAVRIMLRGTHKGVIRTGIAPTGRTVEGSGIEIYRIAGGKVVEKWMNFDFLGLTQQVSATPSSEQSDEANPT